GLEHGIQIGQQARHTVVVLVAVGPAVSPQIRSQYPVAGGELFYLVLPLAGVAPEAMQQHNRLQRSLRPDINDADLRAWGNGDGFAIEFQVQLHEAASYLQTFFTGKR